MSGPSGVWLDGNPLSEDWSQDRALHYGDGLFETMVQTAQGIRFIDLHAQRLAEGCRRLGIPLDAPAALAEVHRHAGPGPALLKLIVSRGLAVERGYGPFGTEVPRQLLLRYALAPPPPSGTPPTPVVTLRATLGENPLLAGLKHLNRLEQVLARAELAATGAFEGLMFSASGLLASGTMCNVFMVVGGHLITPRVDRCGIAGVMRAVVLREARREGLVVREMPIEIAQLQQAEEAFLTNVRIGVRSVTQLDGRALERGPVTRLLQHRVACLDA